jgi:hypothetical protein
MTEIGSILQLQHATLLEKKKIPKSKQKTIENRAWIIRVPSRVENFCLPQLHKKTKSKYTPPRVRGGMPRLITKSTDNAI